MDFHYCCLLEYLALDQSGSLNMHASSLLDTYIDCYFLMETGVMWPDQCTTYEWKSRWFCLKTAIGMRKIPTGGRFCIAECPQEIIWCSPFYLRLHFPSGLGLSSFLRPVFSAVSKDLRPWPHCSSGSTVTTLAEAVDFSPFKYSFEEEPSHSAIASKCLACSLGQSAQWIWEQHWNARSFEEISFEVR